MVTYFGLGIAFFIFLMALRQNGDVRWVVGSYWFSILLLGVLYLYFQNYIFFAIALIPATLRVQIKFWLGGSVQVSSLAAIPIVGLLLWLLIQFTNADFYIVLIVGVVEIISTFIFVSRRLESRGIKIFSNSGTKVTWIFLFCFGNLLAILTTIAWYSSLPFDLAALNSIVYTLIILVGVVKFSGVQDVFSPIINETKYAKSTLEQGEKFRILKAINFALEVEKFYLDPGASLAGLAKKTKVTPHQVSQVINDQMGFSFFELLAHHRVLEGKRLLKSKTHGNYKIEEIADQVGYLSKSAFNTSFKKFTGKTPSEYRKNDVREHKVVHLDHRKITADRVDEGTFGYIKFSTIMLANFFKIYFRTLLRNKAFSFINIFGLTIGLTSTILIFIFLRHELSYDKFHNRAEDIYRVAYFSDNPQTRTPHPLAQALVRDFANVEAAVSLSPIYGPGLTLQSVYVLNPETQQMFAEPDGYMADSTFFDVFNFEILEGNKHDMLRTIGGVVITRSLADRYFGNEEAIGKRLKLPSYGASIEVTGVMADPPANSHFHPQFIISYVTRKAWIPNDPWFEWGDYGHFNYVKLIAGTDPTDVESAIPDWLFKYSIIDESTRDLFHSRQAYLGLQPITDIHLKSQIKWELEANSNMISIYILIAAMAFLVIIASINFINLSTARAFERAKEVGVRKTLGADNLGVSLQFMTEAVVTSLFSLLFAYLIALLVFGEFVNLLGQPLSITELYNPSVIFTFIGMAMLVGLITGLYPAIAVTKIHPDLILKGKFVNQSKGIMLRKSLILVQFVVSAVMIFGSLTVMRQVNFMAEKELGFDATEILVMKFHNNNELRKLPAIKNELMKITGVVSVAGISNIPGDQFNQNSIFLENDPSNRISCAELRVDFDALNLLGIDLQVGRWFDKSMQQDSAGMRFIVNVATIKALGLEDPIGTKLVWDEEAGFRKGNIIGVIEDFHFKSMHESVQPMIINVNPGSLSYLMVKINSQNMSQVLDQLETVHANFDQQFDFDYSFLDQKIGKLYDAERKALNVFNLFTMIALLLSSIGLIGLAYLIISQRTREIGIRKVMGARVLDILWMENKSFLKIMVLALIVGLPISFLVMERWTDAFAYQAPFSSIPFLWTMVVIASVVISSVSLAVLRTVLRNPGDALRYE